MSQISLNTNLAAMRTTRRLAESTTSLRATFERLASGLRINRASDDAAGMSIAGGLRVDSRVYAQGVRNLNDGIGLLNVADGAVEQLQNIVVRLRELASQSANGTLSNRQRVALNQEAQQLSEEYTRIVRSTRFNDRLLFDHEFGQLSLQAGYGANGGISAGLGGYVGDGTFNAQSQVGYGGAAPNQVQSADFNGDGFKDLAYVNAGVPGVSIRLGAGDGTFGSAISFSTPTGPYALAVGDFNNDGIADLAVDGTAVSVLLGNGDGTFRQSYNNLTGIPAATTSMRIADLDGDGNQDLVVGTASNFFGVFRGDGAGGFHSPQTFTGPPHLDSVTVADFNGDGVPDVVAASVTMGTVSYFQGKGDGTFEPAIFTPSGSLNPYWIESADFNGDGHLDIVTSDYSGSSINVRLGRGNGTFTSAQNFAAGAGAYGMALGDFNGDGKVDIAVSNYSEAGTNALSILLGNGDGTFQEQQRYDAGTGGSGIAASDFNNDGVIDLAIANDSSTFLSVLLGNAVSGAGPLLPFDLGNRGGAMQAISQFDLALRRLSQQRGAIGAFLSRIEVGAANLRQASESFDSSASRIVDADLAEESANLTRARIVQIAATSILEQANLSPQLALRLLTF